MTLYELKPAFQALLRPLVARLARLGVTANQITVAAGLGSVMLGSALILAPRAWLFVMLAPWMLIRMALNAMDGMLAREFGQQSALGAYLNELADVVSDAILLLPFALQAPRALVPGLLLVFLSPVSEMAGTLGMAVGAGRRNEGPLGKSDRALLLALLALWLGWTGLPFPWTATVLWVACALVGLNIFRRTLAGTRLATSQL